MNITSLFHTQGKESSLTIISLTITTFAERMRIWWGCFYFLPILRSPCQRSQRSTLHHYSFSEQLPLALAVIHHNEVSVVLV